MRYIGPSGDRKFTKCYRAWLAMRKRCRSEGHPDYHRYGGRGINICAEWDDYENFYRWSLENGIADDLTIDRIDNNGNYEPSNCRWTTWDVQKKNNNYEHRIEFNGMCNSIRGWARHLGVRDSTLHYRLKHWTLERALTTGVGRRRDQ